MLHMSPLELATAAKEAVLAGAACATVTIAYFGLSTWNRQLRGQADFEVARSLARSMYKLRDEVEIARVALVRGWEFPAGYFDGPRSSKPASAEGEAWAHVYGERWKPVVEAVREFDTFILEAEALWGSQVRACAREMHACLVELRTSMDAVVANAYSGGEDFKSDPNFGKEMRSNISARSDRSGSLSQRIHVAIQAIEAVIRPHLRR
jgi:hypothetical protein